MYGGIEQPLILNDRLFFVYDHPQTCPGVLEFAAELWVTDGSGTPQLLSAPIRHIEPLGWPFRDPGLIPFRDELVFTVRNRPEQLEAIGITDGTIAGTRYLPLECPHGNCDVHSLTAIDEQLIYVFADALWAEHADGSVARLTDEEVEISRGERNYFELTIALDDRLFFWANWEREREFGSPPGTLELWVSDGTAEGTHRIGEQLFHYPTRFTNVDGSIFFFSVVDPVSDGCPTNGSGCHLQLWKSDGTEEGTQPLDTNVTWREVGEVVTWNGLLVFDALRQTPQGDGTLQTEGGLWASDGTREGTRKLTDLALRDRPEMAWEQNFETYTRLFPSELTAFQDGVYFVHQTESQGREIWKTDGTPEGTQLDTDIYPGPASSTPRDLTVVDDTLFFSADDGIHGREIWAIEGNSDTALVGDIDRDGIVGFSDFLILSANFGNEGVGQEHGDVNEDHIVNLDDFFLLAENYGSRKLS